MKKLSNYYWSIVLISFILIPSFLASLTALGNISTDVADGISHKRVKRWLNGAPAIVNILTINPKKSKSFVRPSNGSYFINSVKRVKEIVHIENAVAGINASYFKPDNGAPIGLSIIDNKILTGPLFKRVSLGISENNEYIMGKVDIKGEISIGDAIKLPLFNVNQPVFSKYRFNIFTDKWGKRTPKTSVYYSQVVIKDNKVSYIKNSRVLIPKDGYVIVGPHNRLPKNIKVGDQVSYSAQLVPDNWNSIKYAISGGPYLVKEGQRFIDKQNFSRRFLWSKAPRTAIGYTKGGILILVTVDGRHPGFSEGATLPELSTIMRELGAYNAMNLDGGGSTQMVINGKLVNYPAVKGGSKVTNALVIGGANAHHNVINPSSDDI